MSESRCGSTLWPLLRSKIIKLHRVEAKTPKFLLQSVKTCPEHPHANKQHSCVNHSLVTFSWLTTWWQLNSFITEASFKNSILSRMLADSLTVFMATLVSGSSFTTPLAIPSYTIPKEPCPSSRHMVIFSRGTSHSSGTYTKERERTGHEVPLLQVVRSLTALQHQLPKRFYCKKHYTQCRDLTWCAHIVHRLFHTEIDRCLAYK